MEKSTVVRTERGLSIVGTRITLYDILDYLKQDWSPRWIQYWFNLTDEQIGDVIRYIEEHRAEVEAEYQLVLQQGEESQRYWKARNQHLFAQLEMLPLQSDQALIKATRAQS